MKRIVFNAKYRLQQQWRILLVIAILSVVSTFSFSIHFRNYMGFGSLNVGDFLFWNLRGMQWAERIDKVIVPNGYWLAVNLLLAVMVGKSFEDMSGAAEMQKILRIGSRKSWWDLKVRECIVTVLAYYSILIVATIFSAFCMKAIIGIPHFNLVEEYGGLGFEGVRTFLMAIMFILFTSITISVIQALITVTLDIKLGFVWVALILVLAIYTKSWWSMGSGLMLIRLSQYGINDYLGNGLLCIILTTIAYVVGSVLIKKKDFIKKEK